MDARVLVVEDDAKTAELVRLYLEREGCAVTVAADGLEGLRAARAATYDLILLDVMLPGLDGFEVCRAVRERSETPIIIVTARSAEGDALLGLDLGADDYVTKPFRPRELVARARAVLRRASAAANEAALPPLTIGDLTIDPRRHEIRRGGQALPVTRREFQVMLALASEPGRVFSRADLVGRAFGYEYDGLERTVDAHIRNLRRKVESDPTAPRYIETVYAVGYRLAQPATDAGR